MQRLRVRFGRGDSLKYISHLDMVRLWQRAFHRAGVPLAYSEGFNPHPHISLASPLAMGVTSAAELMDVYSERMISPHGLMAGLKSQVPDGIDLLQIVQVNLQAPSLQASLRFAEYEVILNTSLPEEEIKSAIKKLMLLEHLPWQHKRDTGVHSYDLRALIKEILIVSYTDNSLKLSMKLRSDSAGAGPTGTGNGGALFSGTSGVNSSYKINPGFRIATMRLGLDPIRQKQAKEFARKNRISGIIATAIELSILLLLIFTGLTLRVKDFIAMPPVPGAFVYFVVLFVAYSIISAPSGYYQGHVLARRYDLSTRTAKGWLVDEFKGFLITLIIGSAIVAALYALLSAFPLTWWLFGWVGMILLSIIFTSLAPVLFIPLFLKMKPMPDSDIRVRLANLVRRAGIKVKGIYIIEFSSKGTTANAAVMGLGSTRRIVLSDTLIQRYTPEEIEVIMAHEIAHHVNNDTTRLMLINSVVMLFVFLLTDFVFQTTLEPLGYSAQNDFAALPWLITLFAVFSTLFSPLLAAFSRRLETDADKYALKLTGDGLSFINSMTRLTEQNLADATPNPWIERLSYDHPSYYRRIALAEKYDGGIELA